MWKTAEACRAGSEDNACFGCRFLRFNSPELLEWLLENGAVIRNRATGLESVGIDLESLTYQQDRHFCKKIDLFVMSHTGNRPGCHSRVWESQDDPAVAPEAA